MKILDLENKTRRCVTNTKFLEVEERILIPKTTFIIRIFYLLPFKKKKEFIIHYCHKLTFTKIIISCLLCTFAFYKEIKRIFCVSLGDSKFSFWNFYKGKIIALMHFLHIQNSHSFIINDLLLFPHFFFWVITA